MAINNHHCLRCYHFHNVQKWRDQSFRSISILRREITLLKPQWTPIYIKNYIISRYGDMWHYYDKNETEYSRLTELKRNLYRLNLVTKHKLSRDVRQYIAQYL